jgi:hypothetical protein
MACDAGLGGRLQRAAGQHVPLVIVKSQEGDRGLQHSSPSSPDPRSSPLMSLSYQEPSVAPAAG